MPGTLTSASSIFLTNSFLVEALVHSERGFNGMKMSCWESSMGLVAMSGRPMRVAILSISSGNCDMRYRSTNEARSMAVSTEIPGR